MRKTVLTLLILLAPLALAAQTSSRADSTAVQAAFLAEDTAQPFATIAHTQEQTFRADIQPLLTMHGDEASIRKLLTILLDNAAKYTPAHGTITLSLKRSGRQIRLAVENSADGLEKGNAKGGTEDDSRPAPEFSFDLDTCPILFVHGDADGWAAMNSVKAWEQLRRMGVQGELHTLATRGHCFQRDAAPGTGSYTYLDRIWEFMNHKGYNAPDIPK